MKLSSSLLKARHIGIRELKTNLSKYLKQNKTMIITDHGTPTNVIVSYDDIIELIDILDEVMDSTAMSAVKEGREAITKGTEGTPVSELFDKMRKSK